MPEQPTTTSNAPSSESRPPWSSRLNRSRPNSSVPSGAAGRRSRKFVRQVGAFGLNRPDQRAGADRQQQEPEEHRGRHSGWVQVTRLHAVRKRRRSWLDTEAGIDLVTLEWMRGVPDYARRRVDDLVRIQQVDHRYVLPNQRLDNVTCQGMVRVSVLDAGAANVADQANIEATPASAAAAPPPARARRRVPARYII